MKRLVVVLAALVGCNLTACNDAPSRKTHADPLGGMRPVSGLKGSDGRIWRPQKNDAQTSGEVLPRGVTRNPDGSVSYGGSIYRPK